MDKDARLNDLIRLKQVPSAPLERWQMMPTRTKSQATFSNKSISDSPYSGLSRTRLDSPLRPCQTNVQPRTPESSRLVIKYKKSPKVRGRHTPSKTPGHSTRKRTPPKSSKKKTPGRTGQTPSGCRFIPNRSVFKLRR